MSLEELDKLEQQRRDADRAYNDALTAFDGALVRTAPQPAAPLEVEATAEPVPEGWRGWPVRAVQQWLSPWMERQNTMNARAAATIRALKLKRRPPFTTFAHRLMNTTFSVVSPFAAPGVHMTTASGP